MQNLLTWLSTQITNLTEENKELKVENDLLKSELNSLRAKKKPKEPWEPEDEYPWNGQPYKPGKPWGRPRYPWRLYDVTWKTQPKPPNGGSHAIPPDVTLRII